MAWVLGQGRTQTAGICGVKGGYVLRRRMPRKPTAEFPPPALVRDSAALAALCSRLRAEPFITIDTEFMRERTYYPELCVVQLGGERDVAVIDAQAEGIDLAPLGELLADPNVVKV